MDFARSPIIRTGISSEVHCEETARIQQLHRADESSMRSDKSAMRDEKSFLFFLPQPYWVCRQYAYCVKPYRDVDGSHLTKCSVSTRCTCLSQSHLLLSKQLARTEMGFTQNQLHRLQQLNLRNVLFVDMQGVSHSGARIPLGQETTNPDRPVPVWQLFPPSYKDEVQQFLAKATYDRICDGISVESLDGTALPV